jgi:hypothetical protein
MSRSSQATDQKQREKSSFYDVLVNRRYFIFIFPSIFDKTLFSINKINVLKYFQKVLKDFCNFTYSNLVYKNQSKTIWTDSLLHK